MARTRAPDYAEHHERILAQAVQAFARIGYPSASMSQLAQACGVSKATLYHYFPSKDALLFEALDRYTRLLGERVAAVRARGLPERDELAEIVRALMAQYRSSHAYHGALVNDVKFLPEPERRVVRAQERAIVDAVAASIERAFPQTVTTANRTVVTMALLGMINFTFAWLRPDGEVSHSQFAEAAIELWLRGLEGGDLGSLQSPARDDPQGDAARASDPDPQTSTRQRHEQAVRIQS